MQGSWFNPKVRKVPWRREWLPTPVFLGFPVSSDGKESACNVGDMCLFPGLGKFPGKGNGYPLQYSCLEYSIHYIISACNLYKNYLCITLN